MTIEQAKRLALVAVFSNQPVFIWGAQGIGKSDLAYDIARTYGDSTPALRLKVDSCETPDQLVKDVRLLLRNIVHLMGLPNLDANGPNGRTVFSRPADIPTEDEPTIILLLEELNLAPQSVQAAAYGLVLDRRIGDYKLPEYVRIIATGNRREDRGATHDMPVPLRDRFGLHLTVHPDRDTWLKWAAQNGIRSAIIAWIRWQGHIFLHISPGATVKIGDASVTYHKDANAFPTPRRYAKLSLMMDTGLVPSDLEREFVASCIGEPLADQFCGFLRIVRQLPNPANIVINPMTCNLPNDSAGKWSCASSLASHATEQNFANCLKYLNRFESTGGMVQKEYAVFFVKSVAAANPEIQNTTAFNNFIAENSDIIF